MLAQNAQLLEDENAMDSRPLGSKLQFFRCSKTSLVAALQPSSAALSHVRLTILLSESATQARLLFSRVVVVCMLVVLLSCFCIFSLLVVQLRVGRTRLFPSLRFILLL